MTDCSALPTVEDSELFKQDAGTINEVVTSPDSYTTPASDGLQKKTLAGLAADAAAAIQGVGFINKGEFSTLPLIENVNEVAVFEGNFWLPTEPLPYTATGSSPLTPPEDGKWVVAVTAELLGIARSLNCLNSQVIYSTDTITVLDDVLYIYDAGAQIIWGVPTLDSTGETIVSVAGDHLTTTGANSYTLTSINRAGVEFETIDDINSGRSIGGKVSLVIGDSVRVLDYGDGNNSGVLFFRVVAAGTGVHDGGQYIDLPSLSLQLEQNFKHPHDLKAWGSKEGVDSTPMLANFISWVGSGTRDIIISSPTLLTSITLTRDIGLIFQDAGQLISSGTVEIQGNIVADINKNIFAWTTSDPTNLVGTSEPFLLSGYGFARKNSYDVSVRWFGASGDGNTSDTASINAACTAVNLGMQRQAISSTNDGPASLLFPKGLYKLGAGDSINISYGTNIIGDGAGSHTWSAIYRNDGDQASMLIYRPIRGGLYPNAAGAQHITKNMKFYFKTTLDFATSEAQLDTAVIEYRGTSIDNKFHGCWFLGTPQKGSVFKVGNKYEADGVTKVDTGDDSDGSDVIVHSYDTFFDVINGTLTKVVDRGVCEAIFNTCLCYQLYLGLTRNTGTSSTQSKVTLCGTNITGSNIDVARIEVAGGSNVLEHVYTNTEISIKGSTVQGLVIGPESYSFQQSLRENCDMILNNVDIIGEFNFINQMFDLSFFKNSLFIDNCRIRDATFNSGTSLISKNSGSASLTGSSRLHVSNNFFQELAFPFLKHGASFCPYDYLYFVNNTTEIVNGGLPVNTGQTTKYLIEGNSYKLTPNLIETIPT